MSRSIKKGPYINIKLEKKVLKSQESKKKTVRLKMVSQFIEMAAE